MPSNSKLKANNYISVSSKDEMKPLPTQLQLKSGCIVRNHLKGTLTIKEK